jgi:hypothetical protein
MSVFQTNLVRFASNPETNAQQALRDKENEETWCSDYRKFASDVQRRGIKLSYRKHFAPGEKPVRVILDKTRTSAQIRLEASGSLKSRQISDI